MKSRVKTLAVVILFVLLVAGLTLAAQAGPSAQVAQPAGYSQVHGPRIRLLAGEFDPLESSAPAGLPANLLLSAYPGDGDGYYIVQFHGPIATPDREALAALGAEVFDYLPDFAFVAKMGNETRTAVEAMEEVRWVGLYQPAYRLSPALSAAPEDDTPIEVVASVFRGEELAPIIAQVETWDGAILDQSQTEWKSKLVISISPSRLADLATIAGVRWIEKAPEWKLANNESADIMGVRKVWNTHGLYGDGQTIAVCDTGLDQGSASPASLHDDFEDGSGGSRGAGIHDRVNQGEGADDVNSGHGTHVAGSVLGNGDLSGATPGSHIYPDAAYVGIAPEASLVFQAVENDLLPPPNNLTGIPADLNTLFAQAASSGATLHTNSWGSAVEGEYTSYSQDVDEYVWNHKDFTILFAAGNDGIDSNSDGVVDLDSMGSPGTAKNCITVGATENDRPSINSKWSAFGFSANPIRDDLVADDPDGMAAFSSRGPADDSRIKPDIVAPGTYIASTRSSVASGPGWGTIDANYIYMGGTSMATPLTAGAATVVRQFYVDVMGATPSAALIKATLVNGATNIAPGQYGTGPYQEIPLPRPTNVAGWGRVNLENSIFPAAPRAMSYKDQATGLSTGGADIYTYTVTSNAQAFRVTLAWSDYPGLPAAAKELVNDLDLKVTGPTGTDFYPKPGAAPDRTNNLVGIDLSAPITGVYTVTVSGYNVPQSSQPYALVVSGILGNSAPVISGLPDQTVPVNGSADDAIDLWAYTWDPQSPDSDLTFTIDNTPTVSAGVTIDNNRYIDINPAADWEGQTTVVIRAQDPGGLSGAGAFSVTVSSATEIYLPLVVKNYPPPSTWVTIVSEDFEGAFPGSWTVDDNKPGFGEYYWAKRNCRSYEGSYSGWAVGGGADGSALSCGSNYPNVAGSWMIYGPFSLAGATAADLSFKLWLNSESSADVLCRSASTNGTSFYGSCTSGDSEGWIDRTLDLADVPTLGNLLGQTNVWVALIFNSDASSNYAEGGYVDNIVLRKDTSLAARGIPPVGSGAQPDTGAGQLVETPAAMTLEE